MEPDAIDTRFCALNNAVDYAARCHPQATTADVLALAAKFEAWLTRSTTGGKADGT